MFSPYDYRQRIRKKRKSASHGTSLGETAYYETAGWLRREAHRVGRLLRDGRPAAEAQDFLQRVVFKQTVGFPNLRDNLEYLMRYAGYGPGPDGVTYDSFDPKEWFRVLRDNEWQIRHGEYRPGALRKVEIPKDGGGVRELHLPNCRDRIVDRAVYSVVCLLTDLVFGERSFGFRPGLGVQHALAAAKAIAEARRAWCWRKADIAHAFDTVPIEPLIEIVHRRVPNEQLAGLIEIIINRPGTEWEDRAAGIPQGSSLSPWLLNLLLDEILDQPYQQADLAAQMIRYADDILIVGRNPQETDEGARFIEAALRNVGLSLKEEKNGTADLAGGEETTILGLTAYQEDGEVRFDIPLASWQRLEETASRLFEPETPQEERLATALDVARGWTAFAAPTLGKLRGTRQRLVFEACSVISTLGHVRDLYDGRAEVARTLAIEIEEWMEKVEAAKAAERRRPAPPAHSRGRQTADAADTARR